LKSLALANGLLSNVRVAVLDLRTLNGDRLSGPVNGVFGYAEMRRLEAIVDCGRQTIYTRTPGVRGGTSAMLKQYLIRQGFTHVPMHVDAQRHFEVVCAINGHPSKMVVDTASVFSCIHPRTAARAGIAPGLTRMSASAAGNRRAEIRAGRAKEFSVGNFNVAGGELAVVDVTFDTLGIEHLTFNSAIIDIEGLSLYLRHSSRR
jgi:hypothetical protein